MGATRGTAPDRIAIAIADPENPYRYRSVRGEVVERREGGAREHQYQLAERYTGQPRYPGPGGRQRSSSWSARTR